MSNQLPGAMKIGIRRGGLEIKQFFRQRESVVFTLLINSFSNLRLCI